MSTIYNLPKEMVERILVNLDARSASCIFVSCTQIHNLLYESLTFWRHLCQELYLTTWEWERYQETSDDLIKFYRKLYQSANRINNLLHSGNIIPAERLVMNPTIERKDGHRICYQLENEKNRILKLPDDQTLSEDGYNEFSSHTNFYKLKTTVIRYVRTIFNNSLITLALASIYL